MAAVPSSSRGAASAASAVTLLSTTTLSVNGTFDVASIDQTYNDLVLILMVRGAAAAITDDLAMKLNNDAAGNYSWVVEYSLNVTYTAQAVAGSGLMDLGRMVGNTATAGWFTPFEIVITGYTSTTWVKAVTSQFGGGSSAAATTLFSGTASGVWANTAAVNRVQLLGSGTANLLAGSVLRIYGRL